MAESTGSANGGHCLDTSPTWQTDAHPEGHCRRKEANLKTTIQWDGCHETSTASADNTALPTALTFRTTGSSQHHEWHKAWPPVKFFKAFWKTGQKKTKKIHSYVQRVKLQWKIQTLFIFFKGKANIIWQYLQFRVQHILLLHSRKKTKNKTPTFHQINHSID